ncbi:protein BIG GRAIN 1-like E [Amaranthus tricolor]|uniref:protein BIG GRAIN 1-like E n=1 Tax=Amaranthus tricolor TaxID=29722 RepID=UPI00258748A4|nr:protein BIG GRAIN 1-like E [Amaranthus tricolor]
MSIKDYKEPFHRRNNSGELDVFEADRYFSGSNDNYTLLASANLSQKMASRDEKRGYLRQGRASLDIPSPKYYYLHQNNHPIVETKQHHHQQQQKTQEKKKLKQPNSPSGKIAQFLNSLFNQTNSKKNKKKSMKSLSSTQSMKDEDESPIRRRKRSSISHFWSTSSAIDTTGSGFRTPPPYDLNHHHQPNIPFEYRIWLKESDRQSIPVFPWKRVSEDCTKSDKDFRTFSDNKDVLGTLSKYKIQENGNPNVNGIGSYKDHDKIKSSKNLNHGYQKKTEHKKIVHEEYDHDGAESDSSSDLFELKIDYGFGFCSSGLPVYETTHMDNIKRSSSTSFTNGPIKA